MMCRSSRIEKNVVTWCPEAASNVARSVVFAIASLLAGAAALAADPLLITSLDEPRFTPPKEQGRMTTVEGKIGNATQFAFDDNAKSAFFTSNLRGTPEWDQADGLSFWVKGNGTTQFGGLQLIYDDDYALRYDVCFPIKGTEWTRIVIAWNDFIPVLPSPRAKPLGTREMPPGKVTAVWFGRWWYWGDYPATTFAVDEIRLEPTIGRGEPIPRPQEPLGRVLKKLKAGEPITIVTMGDSLTDTRHWANRQVVWPTLLASQLNAEFKSEVTIINPAIGGTQLRQNLILMPRWLDKTPEPDLVTLFFGGNDWESGMRGEEFTAACADAVARIRQATRGKSDVLLITTNPTAEKWQAMGELSVACREAARAQGAGLADTEAAFHRAGQADRNRLYVDDRVHLSKAGHAVVAQAVLEALTAENK